MVLGKLIVYADVTVIDDQVEESVWEAQPIIGLPVDVIVTVVAEDGETVNLHPVCASVGAEAKFIAVEVTLAVASAFDRLPSHEQ